jgi:hypothetical protein
MIRWRQRMGEETLVGPLECHGSGQQFRGERRTSTEIAALPEQHGLSPFQRGTNVA